MRGMRNKLLRTVQPISVPSRENLYGIRNRKGKNTLQILRAAASKKSFQSAVHSRFYSCFVFCGFTGRTKTYERFTLS